MQSYTGGTKVQVRGGWRQPSALTLVSRPGLIQWITGHEVEALREALSRGCLPPDFHQKLRGLAGGELGDRFIEQNCRLFAALLLAIEEGSFHGVSQTERDRLLRVLAYVCKVEDAIPDYQPRGLQDDQQEVRAATVELGGLLKEFKEWRLRHQVPVMWSQSAVSP